MSENLLLLAFNNVIELGQFVCVFIHANLRNSLTDLSALLYYNKLPLTF